MKWNQRLFVLLLILPGMVPPLLSDVRAAETPLISLSGAVYRSQDADAGLTDVFLAELSKQSGVNILDRSAMKLVFGELSLANLSDDALNQVRLGKIMGVDYFAWVKLSDNLAVLEVVEATTGRSVIVAPFRFEQAKLSTTWPAIAAEAVRAARQGAPSISAKMPSLAMTNPRLVVTNETVTSATEALLTQLSGDLGGEGVTVLPRRFTQELVTERWRAEKGLVQSGEQQQLLGADYILTFTVDGTPPVLEMGLVEAKTGRRVGRFREPLADAVRDKKLNQWLMARLRLVVNQPPVVTPATTNTQVAIVETLEAFYKGVVLHNQGYYLDALSVFNSIHGQNAQIKETDRWMEKCCLLSGFPEVADEVRNHSTNALGRNMLAKQLLLITNTQGQNMPAKQTLLTQTVEGIALLGIMGAPGVSRTMTGPLGILLVDALSEHTRSPVLVTEDIAELRDEYDLLLGLVNIKGVTWQKAPALLLSKSITAHVETSNDEFSLRLCLIENVDPTSIKESRTRLPSERSQWRGAVREAVHKLLADKSSVGWQPPRLIFAENKDQLHDQIKMNFNCWSYLKFLTLDPACTGYLVECDEPIRSGLTCWFARSLPKDHPDLPVIDFSVASLSMYDFGTTNGVTRIAQAFRKVAGKYPAHPAGMQAQYNTLLAEMNPDNFEITQAKMSEVIAAMDRYESELTFIGTMRRMELALRFALGKPGGTPQNTILFRHFIIASQWIGSSAKDERLGVSFISCESGSQPYPYGADFVFPRTREKMKIDLESFCEIRDHLFLPPAYIMKCIAKYGRGSELAKYIALKYLPDAYHSAFLRQQWADEDLLVVCEDYVAAMKDLLASNPPAISKADAAQAIKAIDGVPEKEPFLGIKTNVQQTVAKSFSILVPSTNAPSNNIEWKVTGLVRSYPWVMSLGRRSSVQYPSITNAMIYSEYLVNLHQDFDDKRPVIHEIAQLYCQFVIVFFWGKRFDLAEPLLEQIVLWRDSKGRPPEKRVHSVALYLLATLKLRNGDGPAALALAKEDMAFLKQYPNADDGLPISMFSFYNSAMTWSGDQPNIGIRIAELIKLIRENPQANFKNPYY